LRIQVVQRGPDQSAVSAVRDSLLNHPNVKKYLKGARNRILSFELIDEENKSVDSQPPSRFRALIYDYTLNLALRVEGDFQGSAPQARVVKEQPSIFNEEEFAEATSILAQDKTFGPLVIKKRVQVFQPMPPILEGSAERVVMIGLRSPVLELAPEIVGVNMGRKTLVRFPKGAPGGAFVSAAACGPPNANQGTTSRGVAGEFQVTVTQGSETLWSFLAVRPSASSGTRGSGVELRDVRYRGKLVLRRAHTPILNVQYDGNLCGPYRDWQWQEGFLTANGTDVASGFRLCQPPGCTAKPQTILDTGSDSGNFLGVGAYIDGNSAVLVSEMQAGWYRYVSRWEFSADGTMLPRFGFGGVNNSCVCNVHNHHVYWRLDFDIESADSNVVFGPALRWWPYPVATETRIVRSSAADNTLLVQNRATGATYKIIPGDEDGIADTYARGDVWVLAYKSTELDDGHNSTNTNTEADLDQFVNGQGTAGGDIVVWYRAGFRHIESSSLSAVDSHTHIVGPTLVPVSGY
jgi:hypothetical protein